MNKQLIFFSMYMSALAGCGAKDACLDDGGVYSDTTQSCLCSYSALGVYEKAPTPEQLAEQKYCKTINTGDDIS